jgi:hypothetical protein
MQTFKAKRSTPTSLLCKVHDQQRQEKRTNLRKKTELLCTEDEINMLIRHFPQTKEALAEYLSTDKINAYGEELLNILTTHERDQTAFTNCLREMQAFAHGGEVGMYMLNKVYLQILKAFKMMPEINEIFSILHFYTHNETGVLKRKRAKDTDDDDHTNPKRTRAMPPVGDSSSQDY